MLHGDFIKKMADARPVWEHAINFKGDNKWKTIGKKFSILPVVASSKFRYYENHKCDPVVPEMSEFNHAKVMKCGGFFKLSDMDSVRSVLIEKCSSKLSFHKITTCKIPKDILRFVLKLSGLEWFEKNGQPMVHWKH